MLFSSPSKAHQEIVNPFTSEGQISHHCKKIKRKEKEKKERCNVCKICEKSSSKPCPSAAFCATKTRGHLQSKLLRARWARCPHAQLGPPQGSARRDPEHGERRPGGRPTLPPALGGSRSAPGGKEEAAQMVAETTGPVEHTDGVRCLKQGSNILGTIDWPRSLVLLKFPPHWLFLSSKKVSLAWRTEALLFWKVTK